MYEIQNFGFECKNSTLRPVRVSFIRKFGLKDILERVNNRWKI